MASHVVSGILAFLHTVLKLRQLHLRSAPCVSGQLTLKTPIQKRVSEAREVSASPYHDCRRDEGEGALQIYHATGLMLVSRTE